MNRIKRNIPNFITLINLLGGCLAIVAAQHLNETLWLGLSGLYWVYIFIGVSAVADFLDGFVARLLNAWSFLGKELDSLCDLVGFGVAPAMLMYYSLSQIPGAQDGILPWLAFIIPLAAAMRLAKFNIDTRQTTSFIGLPVPANALFWIGFSAFLSKTAYLSDIQDNPWIIAAIILLESWLMVSPLRLFSLKVHSWGWKGNIRRWCLAALAVILLLWLGIVGLMWLIIAYILLSMIPEKQA